MDCSDPLVLMGAGLGFDRFTPGLTSDKYFFLRAANKIISAVQIVLVILTLIIMKVGFNEKLQKLMESSVFSFLDDLSDEFEKSGKHDSKMDEEERFISLLRSDRTDEVLSFQSIDRNEIKLLHKSMQVLRKDIEKSFENHENYNNEGEDDDKEIIICNCYQCFCECLCKCWIERIYKPYISYFFLFLFNKVKRAFLRNIKAFSFYFLMIGIFIYNPLRNILSFFVNACNKDSYDIDQLYFYIILINFIDLICGSLGLMSFFFMISFINTQREFIKVYLFDRTYRARLIYFHLKKAIIFGLIHFLLKLSYKLALLFQVPTDDLIDTPYAAPWLMFKNVFLLLSVDFYNSMFIAGVEQDCRTIRAQAQYFIIQNNLIKSLPLADKVYMILKKEINETTFSNIKHIYEGNINKDFPSCTKKINESSTDTETDKININRFSEKIVRKCKKLHKSLIDELSIIDNQRFQNVLRNRGYLRYLPRIFTILMAIVSSLVIFFADIILLKIFNFDTDLTNLIYFAGVGYSIISFIQCSLFPVLIYYCLKKTTFFNMKTFLPEKQ